MAALSAFYPLIEPDVVGCPQPMMLQHLRAVMHNFFTFSRIWTEDIDAGLLGAPQFPYTVTPPTDARVIGVRQVKFADAYLIPKTRDALRAWTPDWQTITGQNVLWSYTTGQDTFGVVPLPLAAADTVVSVVLEPSIAAATIPDQFFDDYGFGLAAGASARLLLMPNKPWSNPALAADKAAEFAAERRRARTTADKDFGSEALRVSPVLTF